MGDFGGDGGASGDSFLGSEGVAEEGEIVEVVGDSVDGLGVFDGEKLRGEEEEKKRKRKKQSERVDVRRRIHGMKKDKQRFEWLFFLPERKRKVEGL